MRRLVSDGRPVRALARSESSARAVERLGGHPVRGDVLDPEAVLAGMRGFDVVYHVAGMNAHCLPDPAPLFRVNVVGSANVVQAAVRAGVRRVVYTSSAATLGERSGTVGNEESPHRGWFLSDYERSKYEAEERVMELASKHGTELVCLNPSSVQGPGRTGGTARLLLDYLNGKLRAMVETRMSIVDIADCAEGHLLAEARGRPLDRYVLNGATLTTREAVAMLREVSGIDARPRALPPFAASAGAVLAEAAGRIRGRPPALCREMVRTLLHGHEYDGSKAERDLGLRYTPFRDTIRRTLSWYADQGLVPRLALS